MKIIDEFQLMTACVIIIGLPILFYLKINDPDAYTYHIVIYGDNIDATMLAYYIDAGIKAEFSDYRNVVTFNITLVSAPQTDDEPDAEEKRNKIIDKRIFSFCGVEREWMALLDNTNLKYNIKEYGIYFGETIQKSDKNEFRIYSTESSLLSSVVQYGLSNYAAHNFFQKFARSINRTGYSSQLKLQQLSTSNIIRNYLPNGIEEDSLKYFSESLGLDQNYIQNFIFPVIWGNYLHEANSLSTLFKLLPVYCHRKPEIGKSLVLFQDPKRIKEKMLSRITEAKVNFIPNQLVQTYSIVKDPVNERKKYVFTALSPQQLSPQEEENESSVGNDTLRTFIRSDVLFMFEDIDTTSAAKQFSYYKTIIDGKIKNDQRYEEFFTIYLKVNHRKREELGKDSKEGGKSGARSQFNPIYSISRICAYNCKGYESSVYVLVSKHKLSSSKHLQMFESHNIIYFKKFFVQKSQMPSNKKLQENENVYKIYDIDSITDSYEVQLHLVKQIANAFIQKIKKQYVP